MSRQSRTPSPPPLMVTHVDERLEGTDRVSAATWTREIMWDDPYPPTDEQLEAYGRQSYDWLDNKYGSRAFIGGNRNRGSLLVATMYIPFGLDGGVIYQSTIPRGVFRQEISQYGSTYAVNWWHAASSFVTVTNPTTRQREVRSNRDGPHPDHIHAEDVLYYLVERNYRDRFIRRGQFYSRDGPIRIIVYGFRPGYDYRPREQQTRDPYIGVQELCAPGHQKNSCCQDICQRLGCTWIKPRILRGASSSISAGGGGGGGAGSSRGAPSTGDGSRRSGPNSGRPGVGGGGGDPYADNSRPSGSTRPGHSGGMTDLTMKMSGMSVKSSRRDDTKVRVDGRQSSRREEVRSSSRREEVYRDDGRSSTRRSERDPYRDDGRSSRRTTEAVYRDERDRYGEVRRVIRG
ncbi:hypothetical protein QBC41DRAFT_379384 [Cercophora samala]|uniref:Uncharacterized protein n=1 Tax=Cercophora samala TaxID=330535 RepID=A0AA40D9R2_9PEZI|nr:hypothetical protein QBC41DRAFT_379384 [Cercophora samala]